MVKMRVYELAKDLGVDNKELVRQLIDMDLDVRNHMSTLTEDEIERVKKEFKGAKDEVVVEKRVTSRVIRRRKKKVKPEPEAPSQEQAEAEEPESAEPDDTAAEQDAALEPEAAEAAPEEETPAEPVAEAETPQDAEPVAKRKAKPVEKHPAKVIKPAPETEPEPEPEAPAPEPEPVAQAAPEAPAAEQPPEPAEAPEPEATKEEAPAAPEAKAEPEAEAPAAEKPAEEPEPEKTQDPEAEAKAEAPDQEAAEETPKDGEPKPEADEEDKPKPKAKKAKKSKKRFEDTPAKIISRPKVPVQPTTQPGSPPARPARPARPPRPPRPGAPVEPQAPPTDRGLDRPSRKRKKGKKGDQIPDDASLIRKAGSRRREIIDRADLYSNRRGRGKKGKHAVKKSQKTEITTPKAIKRRVKVGEAITVGELAKRMGIKAAEMVGQLMKMGMMVTLNQSLDVEDASLVASEFGFEVEKTAFAEETLIEQQVDAPETLKGRPPVVTIMGHVDHGKTSLLDTIRKANVTAGEAGGITQHIGAYDVHLADGGHVVFVDTPGHAAFTAMRARGAQVTDVVVLVVAADDGIMEQTREAISHSRAAKVPIVVAINKIDKPGADPEKVKRELAEMELVPEDWGGDTICIEVSAKTGEGVPDLLEMLYLQSEILELAANPEKMARGTILEARLDKGRGSVATVLVQEGTLKTGDAFICGTFAGKVRAMFDDYGSRVDSAGPSIPVEVQGLGGVPEAGDDFMVVENDKVAKQVAEHRALKKREAELSAQTKTSLEGFLEKMAEGEVRTLSLVVKADVRGSVEALVDALNKLGNDSVKVEVIQAATGAITETDVMLASASDAIIIGFNVRPSGKVTEVADGEGVEVRTYDVIYQIIEDVTKALTGMLDPDYVEEVIGTVEVRDTFSVPKIGTIAGSYVTSGKVERNAKARLLRDGVVVTTTKVSSLRRFKDDVKEVAQGFECGVGLENYNDIKIGDVIEVFVMNEVAPTL